jgi:hypothetical protein
MGELLPPTHLAIVAIVAVVLFGGKKLAELGEGLAAYSIQYGLMTPDIGPGDCT